MDLAMASNAITTVRAAPMARWCPVWSLMKLEVVIESDPVASDFSVLNSGVPGRRV